MILSEKYLCFFDFAGYSKYMDHIKFFCHFHSKSCIIIHVKEDREIRQRSMVKGYYDIKRFGNWKVWLDYCRWR